MSEQFLKDYGYARDLPGQKSDSIGQAAGLILRTRLLDKPRLNNVYIDHRYKMKIAPSLAQPLILKDLKTSLQTSALIFPRHITGSSTVSKPCTKLLTALPTSLSDEKKSDRVAEVSKLPIVFSFFPRGCLLPTRCALIQASA